VLKGLNFSRAAMYRKASAIANMLILEKHRNWAFMVKCKFYIP